MVDFVEQQVVAKFDQDHNVPDAVPAFDVVSVTYKSREQVSAMCEGCALLTTSLHLGA